MRVLVVEDSKTLADLVVEGLKDEGMSVDVAYDGVDAASMLAVANYEVVVLDRSLPGLSGDALCERISENQPPTMVLMLTGASAPEDRVSGFVVGADDYLAKPFHFPELVLRIRALARRRPNLRSRILRARDVELDPMRHRATRDGQPIELSAKEFGVLEALLRSDGCALSADRLLEQVWDEHADPFTNTVLVTISRLRRKLGDPQIIETIPSVGYRIIARLEDSTSECDR